MNGKTGLNALKAAGTAIKYDKEFVETEFAPKVLPNQNHASKKGVSL